MRLFANTIGTIGCIFMVVGVGIFVLGAIVFLESHPPRFDMITQYINNNPIQAGLVGIMIGAALFGISSAIDPKE